VKQQDGSCATRFAVDGKQRAQFAQQRVDRRQGITSGAGRTGRGALAAAGADLLIDQDMIAVRRDRARRAKVEAPVTADDPRTGFLHERPLAMLRAELADLGIERVEGQSEPEDHAAILCEIMAGLIAGELAAPVERQQYFFDRHLAPWIRRFFADLEAAKAAGFYRPVGVIGRVFIEIEAQA